MRDKPRQTTVFLTAGAARDFNGSPPKSAFFIVIRTKYDFIFTAIYRTSTRTIDLNYNEIL